MITHNGQTYRVEVVTPAGREKYMSFFKKYIYAEMEKGLVDGWQLWQNTVKESDIKFLESMVAENPKCYIETIPNLEGKYNNCDTMRTCEFFKYSHRDDTIYIRFDDDIVWYEPGFIEKMCIARIEYPNAFVIYPNIINSTVCTSWHQRNGALGLEAGAVNQEDRALGNRDWIYLDEFCYTDSGLIDLIHDTFRKRYKEGTLSAYYLPSRPFNNYQRFSICSLAYWGKDHLDPSGFAEEPWMAYDEPERQQRPVYFLGDALTVHYSYHTQRDYLESCTPEKLEFYKQLSENYAKS